MLVLRNMLSLVVTVWLHGHMVGALGLGVYPATSGECPERGAIAISRLYDAQKHRRSTKAKRLQFRYRCSEWDVLKS